MSRIVVRDTEAGNIICEVNSVEDGRNVIASYEETDKADGTYTPEFYECVILD